MLGKKKGAPWHILIEVEKVQLKYELVFSAICCETRSCWEGTWNDDMSQAWRGTYLTQDAGIRSGGSAGLSAVNVEMLRCSGQLGMPLKDVTPCWMAETLRQVKLRSTWLREQVEGCG